MPEPPEERKVRWVQGAAFLFYLEVNLTEKETGWSSSWDLNMLKTCEHLLQGFKIKKGLIFVEVKSSLSRMIGQKLLCRLSSSNNKNHISQLKKGEAAPPPTHYSSVSRCTKLPLLIVNSSLFPLKRGYQSPGLLSQGPHTFQRKVLAPYTEITPSVMKPPVCMWQILLLSAKCLPCLLTRQPKQTQAQNNNCPGFSAVLAKETFKGRKQQYLSSQLPDHTAKQTSWQPSQRWSNPPLISKVQWASMNKVVWFHSNGVEVHARYQQRS